MARRYTLIEALTYAGAFLLLATVVITLFVRLLVLTRQLTAETVARQQLFQLQRSWQDWVHHTEPEAWRLGVADARVLEGAVLLRQPTGARRVPLPDGMSARFAIEYPDSGGPGLAVLALRWQRPSSKLGEPELIRLVATRQEGP